MVALDAICAKDRTKLLHMVRDSRLRGGRLLNWKTSILVKAEMNRNRVRHGLLSILQSFIPLTKAVFLILQQYLHPNISITDGNGDPQMPVID